MHRFLVFAGDHYYPGGGWSDYVGAADTLEAAQAVLPSVRGYWLQIVDQETEEVHDYSWDSKKEVWTSDREDLRQREAADAAKAKAEFDRTHVKLPPGQPYCGDCKIGLDCSWCSCGKYGAPSGA